MKLGISNGRPSGVANYAAMVSIRWRPRMIRTGVAFLADCNALVGALALCIGMGMVPSVAIAKSVLECGTIHTVERGDTLYVIAERAYADGRLYTRIFEANLDLMPNSASIEIGDQVLIPCLDGTGPRTRRDAIALGLLIESVDPPTEPVRTIDGSIQVSRQQTQKTTAPADPLAAATPAVKDPIQVTTDTKLASGRDDTSMRLLTGSGYGPYVDKSLTGGGLITDLLKHSIRATAPEQAMQVAFINDWPAHLDTLLRDGAYEIGFPWYKPDCSDAAKLSVKHRMRCDEFNFSNPIFEIAVGLYTRTGDAMGAATDRRDLIGRKVCRPKGHLLFDPDEIDLMEPDITIEYSDTTSECLFRLGQSNVDAVALIRSRAETYIREAGMADTVTEIPDLAFSQTVHAVVHKSNPKGRAQLDIINQGLANLMVSGQWFSVVAVHERALLTPTN
jgi:polar amino acid transport system substrate-binding protein